MTRNWQGSSGAHFDRLGRLNWLRAALEGDVARRDVLHDGREALLRKHFILDHFVVALVVGVGVGDVFFTIQIHLGHLIVIWGMKNG